MQFFLQSTPHQPLTLTTFLFPFCAPPGAPGGPGAAPILALASCAFIPALTVSISTPELMAGEYGETRLAKGGSGSGGMGKRLPEAFCSLE